MISEASFPSVFVINMKRSPDRRKAMAERLDALHIPYRFFDAVDGRDLDLETLPAYAKTRRRLFFGRDMTKAEVGCLLSHRAIYQHIVDCNIEAAVILEDDVFLDPCFPEVLRDLLRVPIKWDVIRFLAPDKVQKTGRMIWPLLCKPYALARIRTTPGGAYGYMLTRKAAARFLRHMQKNALPVDILHGYVWKTGLETFILKPSPVSADMVVESTIGYDQRSDKTVRLSRGQRVIYPFARAWLKFSELVGKRFVYWASWPRDMLAKQRSS